VRVRPEIQAAVDGWGARVDGSVTGVHLRGTDKASYATCPRGSGALNGEGAGVPVVRKAD
jgi:hypothetical protein